MNATEPIAFARYLLNQLGGPQRRCLTDFLALHHIAACEADTDRDWATPTSVSVYCQLTTAAATGIVDRLEAEDLIARFWKPADRRSTFLMVTRRGRQLLAGIPPAEIAGELTAA